MARVLGAQEGLRGMGYLWTCSTRDSQGRKGDYSSVGRAWHKIGIHLLNTILGFYIGK